MSITMDTTLASLVTNKRRVSALKSLGIITVGDALTYYPFRVTEPVPLRAIREAAPGQQMAFAAVIRDMRVVPMNARRGYRLEATVDDADFARSRRVPGSTARLTFFSYRKSYVDWVSMRLRAGTSVVVSGMPSEYMGQLQFTHPEILTVAPGSAGAGAGLEGYARDAASGNGAFCGKCRSVCQCAVRVSAGRDCPFRGRVEIRRRYRARGAYPRLPAPPGISRQFAYLVRTYS